MSTIKNFGLAGVSSDVQFGKSGPRLTQTGGVFSLKNASAAALARLEVAAPTSDEHATTRLFVNTGLGTIHTAVGLQAAGTYQANATGNYISAATSVVNSVNRLDTALFNVANELDASQTGAGLNANGTYTAPGGNYINGATSLRNADTLLDTALYAVQQELDTTQNTVGVNTNGTLPAWTGTNYVTGTSSLLSAIVALDNQVKENADTVANLGNAFNYVGVLSGGTEGSPYDLSALPANEKNPGDYFKVGAAGWFVYTGTTAFYANVNDGLIKNTTTHGWDKIDNTDSTVEGTTNRIAVTGSADTGFVVDISSSYVGQGTISTVGTVTSGTWSASTIAVNRGGTGLVTYAAGDILYASGTSTLTRLAKGQASQFLRMNADATAPEYVTLDATHVNFSHASFSATTVQGALVDLNNQITSMTGSEIQSPDGKTGVEASDTNGVRFYDEISSTKTEILSLTGSSAAAILTAHGTGSNINIVLDPKGSGTVDVSSARITNVANATAASDAVPLAQGRAIFSSYVAADFTEANSNVVIGNVNGVVLRIIVHISSPLAGGSVLTVGYTSGVNALVQASEVEHNAAGIYVIDNVTVINQTVNVYITGTGTGTGKVIVEYLAV
jgi:hypothetical protein